MVVVSYCHPPPPRATTGSTPLDESGIKWRIIIVSACYSGGFIKPLKDEQTTIATAADAAHTSFGCSDGSDFTYLVVTQA